MPFRGLRNTRCVSISELLPHADIPDEVRREEVGAEQARSPRASSCNDQQEMLIDMTPFEGTAEC